ncbi:helix-turn-helix domain-containing protein [Pseudomonas luteola]
MKPACKAAQSDTSGSAQRIRLLARLKLGPIDTFTAVRELNVCRPGSRISELRASGHTIHTQLITLTDDYGRQHKRVALYSLANSALQPE